MSVVLACCYGMQVDEAYYRIIKVKNATGAPIEGLQLVLIKARTGVDTMKSDSSGSAEFYVQDLNENDNYSLQITDIDGDLNGSYKSKSMPLPSEYKSEVIIEDEK